jgi:AbiV family abortive infection protein
MTEYEIRDSQEKIYTNGVSHIEVANLLGEKGHYGYAISHLIFAIEELIKYFVVNQYSFSPERFDIKKLTEHHGKHFYIKLFQQSATEEFAEKRLVSLYKTMTNQELTKEEIEIENNPFKEWAGLFGIAFSETLIPDEDKRSFFKWLSIANAIKNSGLYAEYNFSTSSATTPSDFIKSDYELALKYASYIKSQMDVIKSLDKTDDEIMAFLNTEFVPIQKDAENMPGLDI